ncbi:MAG TPA: hypothetical protein PLS03_03990, partial [Terrimicrobiaceae bacterium]|nr:hypothetical protein [Terrimicrobiaceae bacterium]
MQELFITLIPLIVLTIIGYITSAYKTVHDNRRRFPDRLTAAGRWVLALTVIVGIFQPFPLILDHYNSSRREDEQIANKHEILEAIYSSRRQLNDLNSQLEKV